MIIRPMTLSDITKLDELMNHLGYPTTKSKLQERFTKILSLPDYKTLVVEMNEQLVGFVGMCKQAAYEFDEPYVRVLALVVHEGYRRQNIGQALMLAAEDWAIRNHCTSITLSSGNRDERITAHKFYEHLGYVGKSTGFSKSLNRPIR